MQYQRTERYYRNYTAIAACVALLLVVCGMLAAPAFADEEDAGTQTVSIAVTAGVHGSVNGKTGSFTENIDAGVDLTLEMKADEGYVIDTVSINDADLEEEDLEGIAGNQEGSLTLEEVADDMTVNVTFKEDDNVGTGEDGDAEPAAGTGEDGNTPDNETGGTETTDPNTEQEDPAGTTQDDENGTGETADPEGNDGDQNPEDADPANPAATEDGNADEGTEDQKDDAAADADKDKATDSTAKDGKEGKEGTGSETPGKGPAYTSDSTPKTGDELPMKAIALMLSSLCIPGALGGRKLLGRLSGLMG